MTGEAQAERFGWWPAVAVLTLGGLALRIAAAQGGLWTDEAWSMINAQQARDPVGVFLRINHDNNHHLISLTLNSEASGPSVLINQESADEVRVLKRIARTYVIGLPALHAQQFGQKRIIEELFEIFLSRSKAGQASFLPKRLRYIWTIPGTTPARAAADCISCLTENEAYQLHRRLTGAETGSILDPVVR